MELIQLILHLDQTLLSWSQWMGPWLYLVLFLIIFAETGLIVTPFLPGDSLLFAVGALTVLPGSPLDPWVLVPLLMSGALLGDNLNYAVGKWLGPQVFSREDSRIFNRKHLDRTSLFCQRHGGRAVIFARFMPIVRTFVPFVAGVGKMTYSQFISKSLLGAFLWINIFIWAGRFFGNLPAVKTNFHIVIFGVIGVSLLPLAYEAYRARTGKT
jgi:membrane-associated protein